jgi:hypothetical protein
MLVVQVLGFGGMQLLNGSICRHDNIGVVAKPLHATIPNITMDIIIGTRRHPKKFNVPHSRQDEPDHDNAPGGPCRSEEIADRQEVHDARKRQRSKEVGSTSVTEVA